MKVGLRLGILALLLTPLWESGSLSGVALAEDHLLVAQAPEPARQPMPSVPRSIPSLVPIDPIAPAESSETVDELFRQVPFPPSPRPLPGLRCSRPMVLRSVTLSAPPPNPASPLQSEVPPKVWETLQGPFGTVNWGEPQPNKLFAHTFQWSPLVKQAAGWEAPLRLPIAITCRQQVTQLLMPGTTSTTYSTARFQPAGLHLQLKQLKRGFCILSQVRLLPQFRLAKPSPKL
jgi:hypothetical protein